MMDGSCIYCRQPLVPGSRVKMPVVEHVEPLTRGGEDVPENTVIACQSCNASKGNMFLLEWVWSGKFDKHLPAKPITSRQFIKFDSRALVRLRGALSQRDLARAAGVSRVTINRLERGLFDTAVSTGTVNKIATALGVHAGLLVTFK